MVMQDGRVRNNGHKLKIEVGNIFPSCDIPVLGGLQDLTGQSPEQPGLVSELALL